MACRFSELVVDSRDPEALAAFCRPSSWTTASSARKGDGAVEIGPEADFGGAAPTLVFGPVANPTPGKLRLHIDVNPTDRDQDAPLRAPARPRALPSLTSVRPGTRSGTCSPTRRATSSACCAGASTRW